MTVCAIREDSAEGLDRAGLLPWLERTRAEWFLEYLAPSAGAKARHLYQRFMSVARNPAGRVTVHAEGGPGEIQAALAVERLAWDSLHFGMECARLGPYCTAENVDPSRLASIHAEMLEDAIAWTAAKNFRLLQRRLLASNADEIRALERLGFSQADRLITLHAVLRDGAESACSDPPYFRQAAPDDLPALARMARGAFPLSRFVRDERLREAGGAEVYVKWIENLVVARRSRLDVKAAETELVVCAVDGRPAGCLAFRRDGTVDDLLGWPFATLELVLVDPEFRGRGVGRRLVEEAMRRCRCAGVRGMEASTWSGADAALRLYQSTGFQPRAELLTLHRWI